MTTTVQRLARPQKRMAPPDFRQAAYTCGICKAEQKTPASMWNGAAFQGLTVKCSACGAPIDPNATTYVKIGEVLPVGADA